MAQVTYKKMKIKGSPIIVDAAIRDDKGRNISDKLDELDELINDSGFITENDIPTISIDITTDATSDIKTTSPKAVKTYVDNTISTAIGNIDDILESILGV